MWKSFVNMVQPLRSPTAIGALLAAALLGAPQVRADMARCRGQELTSIAPLNAPRPVETFNASPDWDSGGLDAAESAAQITRTLPDSPGSASLALSGLLTLGAYGVLRSARHMHLAAPPQWYHDGGPLQIGHAVAYEFGPQVLPVCWYQLTASAIDLARTPHRPSGDGVRRPRSQQAVQPQAPRAPPQV